jgi:hypothetical protein
VLRRLVSLAQPAMGGGASKRVAPHSTIQAPKRSVIVLWDVENCPVPNNMSGSDAVSAIRRWLEYKGWPSQPPELHIVTAYNIFSNRVHPNFWNQLKHAGVEQIAAGPKHESADRELEQRMRREFRLLPQSEDETCFVLISADMDYLATVRDLLRGRVSILWIHSSAVRLSQSTLRQLEEATRPSTVREPRPIRELTTWEQVLASGLGGGNANGNAADGRDATHNAAQKPVRAPAGRRGRSPAARASARVVPAAATTVDGASLAPIEAASRRGRSRSRSRPDRRTETAPGIADNAQPLQSPPPQQQQQQPGAVQPPLATFPLPQQALPPPGGSRGSPPRSPLPPLRSRSPSSSGSPGRHAPPPLGLPRRASPSPSPSPLTTPFNPAAPLPEGRLAGVVSSWQTARNRGSGASDPMDRQWGLVLHDGVEYWFKRNAVVAPCPDRIQRGMAVEFTAGRNPNRSNNENRPIAKDVRFLPEVGASPES